MGRIGGDPRGRGQRLMEWTPMVAIYESRLWRRSPMFVLASGISFDGELAAIERLAGIDEASRVLDLACGPGIYARPFARRASGGRVVGLDLSRPMLRYAARRARGERLSTLDLVRGTALDLPFRSGAFDVVNCCGAVHLFPDVPRALHEIHRTLAPGGRFTSAVFRHGDGERDRREAERRRQLMGVYAFGRPEYEALLADAGFGDVHVAHEGRRWMIAGATRR